MNNMNNTQEYQSQHIIVQMDTDSLIADLMENGGQSPLSSATTKKHTIIYTQGALSMGNPVKDFEVEVYNGQNIYFTIIPLQLFSYHRLYFTACMLEEKQEKQFSPLLTIPDLSDEEGKVSFILPFDEILRYERKKADGSYKAVNYILEIRLDYTDDQGAENSLRLMVDPKLKIRQTG